MKINDLFTEDNYKSLLTGSTGSFTLELLQPFILQAYRTYVLPVLGKEQMEALTETNDKDLLDLVRETLINYAVFVGFDRLSVKFSKLGLQQFATNEAKPAALETKANARMEFEQAASASLEALIEELEENEAYAIWRNSPVYKDLKSTFFATSRQFNLSTTCTVARDGFLALASVIRLTERTKLKPCLPEVFDRIRTKYQQGTQLNDQEQILITDYFRPAVACLSLANALMTRAVILTQEGTITQFDNSSANRQRANRSADLATVKEVRTQLIELGETTLSNMMDFVLENPEELGYELPDIVPYAPLESLNEAEDRIYLF